MSVDIYGAGAIIWRQRGRAVEVLLVHRPTWKDWSFPKGKVKGKETLQECCLREMKEETGYDVVLGAPLGAQRYTVAGRKTKKVRYWAATVAPAEHPALAVRRKAARASAKEIDDVRWVSVAQARALLSHPNDRELLELLAKRDADGLLRTTPVLIVRHARSVKRSVHAGSETTRPLTKTGKTRAKRLVGVLSGYGVVNIVSSPWKRCRDTVAPYALASGQDVDMCAALTEAAHEEAPHAAAGVVNNVIRRGVPTAVCVHRPTLPTLVAELAAFTPHPLRRKLPAKDPWLKTGQILIAHVADWGGQRVVAYEQVRPAL
ncbi:NUDIX hydrolase [Trueperella pyogenes]|uniref:NUDIX hydrolase n=1 Tax=Trueperella pyogenes TaxID=1661 RepID=UPI000E0DE43A|nr:NUDIX hydrolase [Trueperella pyogenes]QIU87566.1 NUDIX hydrolase [Trueperella pyogenes]WHU57428.1 NUDIX hydrolase [Trueperella pyogenes]